MPDPSTNGPFDYRLFGLHIRSDLPLPELPATDLRSEPQLRILLGEANGMPIVSGVEPVEDGALLSIEGVARFRVVKGSEILVEPHPDAPDRNVRLFLLGSAMGMLLHQRGLLPLHANAVEIDGKGVAFMGPSGSGKSTLAAWFHDQGFRIIADDVCVVRFDESGRALVNAGIPRLRLWKDVLAATGREESRFERSYAGDDLYEKYDVPIVPEADGNEYEIAAMYLLDRGDEFSITSLQGIEAVEAVFANTYRGGFVAGTGNVRTHWEACLRLVGQVPIFSLVRPWGHDRLQDQIEQVLAHARSSNARLRE